MRKTLTTVALMLALSPIAFAGEMGTPPAPQPPSETAQEPSGGEMQNGIMPNGYIPNGIDDGLTQIALDLLALLL